MKRFLSLVAAGLLLLGAVLLARAFRLDSRQVDVRGVSPIPVDESVVAGHLAAAIRYRTVSSQDPAGFDGEQFALFRAYLEETFPALHRALQRTVIGGHSFLYEWPGAATKPGVKPILLMAHLDVVPVESGAETSWEHPPFDGTIADGFIWGRGALDDKANAMALFEAVEILVAQRFTPSRTVYLAFGHDEEVGGRSGARATAEILRQRGVSLEYVLDEGGSITEDLVPGVSQPVAMVGTAEKGYVSVELTTPGDGGHSSMPPPQTAVGVLARAITRLDEEPMPADIGVALGKTFVYLAPEMPFLQRLALANLWLFSGLVERQLAASPATNAAIRTTTAATMFNGGVKENVLPSRASAVVNFRILPGDSIASVIAHVERTIADPRVSIRPLEFASEPSPVSSTNSAAFAVLAATIRQTFPGVLVAPSLVIGATDSRYYADVSDDVYRFAPLWLRREDLSRIHGTNERISVSRYAAMVGFYAQLIRKGT